MLLQMFLPPATFNLLLYLLSQRTVSGKLHLWHIKPRFFLAQLPFCPMFWMRVWRSRQAAMPEELSIPAAAILGTKCSEYIVML